MKKLVKYLDPKQIKDRESARDYEGRVEETELDSDNIPINPARHSVPQHIRVDRICADYFQHRQCG